MVDRIMVIAKALIGVIGGAIYPLALMMLDRSALRFTLFRRFWYHLGILEGIIGREPLPMDP